MEGFCLSAHLPWRSGPGQSLRNFRVKFIYSYVFLISQKYSSSTSSSPFCTNSSLVKEILILSLHTSNAIKCIYVRQLFSSELHGFSWSQTVFDENLGYFTLKVWVTSK